MSKNNMPTNTPEKIYLDLGYYSPHALAHDFNDLINITWSKDNASGSGVEYVRADLSELRKPSKTQPSDYLSALGVIQGEMTEKALAFAEWTSLEDYTAYDDHTWKKRNGLFDFDHEPIYFKTSELFVSQEFETYYQNRKAK